MIEIEKKFIYNEENIKNLIKSASFLGEKVFTDIYYDTSDFSLTTKDIWLRERNGKWELKVSLSDAQSRLADHYREVENEKEIKEFLKISANQNLREGLKENNYFPFCACKTVRKKYKSEPFIIDIDAVEFPEFSYGLVEIEMMVNNEAEMESATKKIMEFAAKHKLQTGQVRGKIVEYLKRIKPEHYLALVNAGVVKDF